MLTRTGDDSGRRRAPAKEADEAFPVGTAKTTPDLWLRPRPRWETAEYRVDTRGEPSDWREVARAIVHGGAVDASTGAPWTIDGDAFATIRASESVHVTVRIGDLPLGDARMPDEARWLRTLEFEPFAPALGGAIDLVPPR